MVERRIENNLSRRNFIKLSLGGAIGMLLNYDCKKTVTGSDSDSTPLPVTYSGNIRGLFTNGVSNGKMIFNGITEVSISEGNYSIDDSHNLLPGKYEIRVETSIGHPRECQVDLSDGGLYVVRSSYPLDNVVEKNMINANEYNNWLSYLGLQRWFSHQPKFFWYDMSLWRGDADSIWKVNENYAVNPVTDQSVEIAVKNHPQIYTDNWVRGELRRESEYRAANKKNDMPDPNNNPEGWIILLVQNNVVNDWAVSQYLNDGSTGDIYNAGMSFNHKYGISLKVVSWEIAKCLGVGQDKIQHHIADDSGPTLKAESHGKLMYKRSPRSNMHGGVDRE